MRGSGALLYELAAAHSRCAVGVLVRVLNAPLPPESFRTFFVCATHAHSHYCPQHWPLRHLGLY